MPAVFAPQTPTSRVVTADGRELPLRSTRLCVRAAGGIAHVRLVQTFANPHQEPLQVTYQLPLPADAAVAGFVFRLGERCIHGEIDRREAARERFERAITEGRTAGLVEQDRSALFTQELGNVPGGAELTAELEIDQPLVWVDGSWEWRFPTTVAPRYLGAAGRVPDADRIAVEVIDPAAERLPARCELDLVIGETIAGTAGATSPSHRLQAVVAAGGTAVVFGEPGGRVVMDRDVVVRWPVAGSHVGMTLQATRSLPGPLAGAAFGVVTLVPPAAGATMARLPRDLIVLLDVSGSMHGSPLEQAQRIVGDLIGALDGRDRLELIAFSSRSEAWSEQPCAATAGHKASALQWLRGLRAGGGTEMGDAILQALAGLRQDAQRQVVLVTDGQIGFEREIVGAIRSALPAHTRVHVVGVGSAPNRSLTRSAARAGRGTEILVGIGEDPAEATARLLAHTTAPLVDQLVLSGTALVAQSPCALPDLFAGAPARIAVQLRPEGGTLSVRGTTANGEFAHEIVIPPVAVSADEVLARWFAREAVEDLETELAATGALLRIDAEIERLGLAHRISTRRTSWVAIDTEVSVDPQASQRRVRVPHELPHGMAMAMLGLRASMPMGALDQDGVCMSLEVAEPTYAAKPRAKMASPLPPAEPPAAKRSLLDRLFGRAGRVPGGQVPFPSQPVRATLRLRTALEWVFELLGCHAWQVPDRVAVVFADGREFVLAIDAARTTANGTFAAGTVVRLVLHAQPGLPAATPFALRLTTGARTIDVPLA